jgi:hypothetical protein
MPARHFPAPDPAGIEAWIRQLLLLTGACASALPMSTPEGSLPSPAANSSTNGTAHAYFREGGGRS